MAAINMPQVGQDLETAVITEWKVKVGDTVKVGDIIALVESDKAVFEVEAFVAGTITKLLYEAGDEGKVFEPMAIIGETGSGESKNRERTTDSAEPEKTDHDSQPSTLPVPPSISRIFASPSARRLARQNEIDLTTVVGSGPNGRIVKEDVWKAVNLSAVSENSLTKTEQPKADSQALKAITPAIVAGAEDQTIPFTKIRQTIADRMTLSATTIPHFYLYMDVDMTAALAWREAYNVTADFKVSINDLIVRAVAKALSTHPVMNSHVQTDKMILKSDINIGVAVSVDEGLIVPVIPHTDKLNLQDISLASKKKVQQAKSGVMKITDPGTFTISNLGMFGVHQFLPIINPPEAAILGVGATKKQVVPGPENTFAVRDILKLTLACDHRAIDGVIAANFLGTIKNYLEKFE